jgi:iron complex outermembrane receptor protein
MKVILSFFLFLFFNLSLQAQNTKGIVSGKITDVNGLPLSFINVTIKEAEYKTSTDEKGNYLLKMPAGRYTILASSIGYKGTGAQINIEAGKTLNVAFKLAEDITDMRDVVVSGVKAKSATATRTLMQIQDIPQSIVVIGQRVIQEQAAFDLTTITRNISGLNFTGNYAGAGSSQFFNARGFDLNDGQSYRWNGMMIWNLGNNYSDNIEQVEFLKGPTSILFGDVAPGGVMNFVTKKPLEDFMAKVDFKTGSWGLIRPAIDITGPITKDRTLRFRLNTSFEKSNSFRDSVSSRKEFIAPTIAWNITPKLSFNVEAVFKKSSATDDAGLVSPDGTIGGLKSLNPSLYLGEASHQYLYSEQDYFVTLTYEINKKWRLKTVGFYGNTDNRPFGVWFDSPDSAGNFARREYGYHQNSKTHTISAEVNGTFYTGAIKHNVLAGIEYQSTDYRYTNDGTLYLLDSSNIYHPRYEATPSPEPANSQYLPYVSIIARTGIYAQDQLMFFNEQLHILLGVRAGRTRQGNHYYQDQLAGTQFAGYTDDIISKNVITPRVGAVYKPRDWWSLYASYSQGYEINSADIFARNYLQYVSPPATTSSQVEFGSKTNLLNNMLGVSVSIFRIDKHNPYGYVYLDPLHPDYDAYDVYYQGHHRSQGIELDADGKISPEWSVTAGAAYTKTEIMDDPGYPTGNVLPNAPKYTGNFWLNYEPAKILKGFSFGAGVFYKDKFFSTLANDPNLEIPPSYTLDASIGYKYNHMGIQLNAMNITNQVSYLNPWQFNMFDVKPLRQFILTLTYQISKSK